MTARHAGRLLAPLLAIVFAAALAGCKSVGDLKASSDQWDPPTAANPIFVMAAVDMSEMPGYFQGATLERLSPDPKMTIHAFRVQRDKDSCIFFTEDLTAGRYQLTDFTIRLPDRDITFKVGDDPRFRGDFTTAGLHFLGAFKPREIRPRGGHGKVSYDLQVVRYPNEREAIERILPDASDDFWKNLLKERLRLLRR